MNANRIKALADELRSRGFLGTGQEPMVELRFLSSNQVLPLWRVAESDPGRQTAQALIDGWDWTSPDDVWEQDQRRVRCQRLLDALDSDLGVLVQALALVILDEINIVRQNPLAVLAARTVPQLKTALRSKVEGLLP